MKLCYAYVNVAKNDAKIHDETFYALVDTWTDVGPETLARAIDKSQWLQVFGHYHNPCIISNLGKVFQIEMAHFADCKQIKFICIDSSDNARTHIFRN